MIFWVGSLLLLQIARVAFLLRSAASFEGLSFLELAKAFAYGMRFDASAIAILFLSTLGLEIILKLIRSKSAETIARAFRVLGVSVFFLAALIDVEYFVISHKRLDASILSIGSDIGDQSWQLVWHYKIISLSVLFALFIFWHLSGRKDFKSSSFGLLKRSFQLIVLIPLAVLLARGGWQEKPIKISSAMELADSRLITLSLSTPFVLIQTIRKNTNLEIYRDFNKSESEKILNNERPHNHTTASYLNSQPTDNVLLIIMESFSVEYSAFTPFVESLKRKGLSFENHFSNGQTSIEAIPSLLAGLPSLLTVPYITSSYVNTQLLGLPSADKNHERDFLFFHGARKGSMYFDSFTKFLGFDYYFAKEDYDGDLSALYDWGVHDHAFLDFAGKKLSNWKRPFVGSLFTLSSHQPFEIPSSFSTTLAQAPSPFARSLRYADHSLQLFFEKYSNQDWFKKTLFIITGDHTSQCKTSSFCSQLGIHRVPLIVFHGSRAIPEQKIYKITQHADIPATIAEYLNLDATKLIPFGKSVLRMDKGLAHLNSNSDYGVVLSDAYYRLGSNFLRCEVSGIEEKACTQVLPSHYPAVYKYLKATRSYFSQSLDSRSFE